jgi:hypothetical protein
VVTKRTRERRVHLWRHFFRGRFRAFSFSHRALSSSVRGVSSVRRGSPRRGSVVVRSQQSFQWEEIPTRAKVIQTQTPIVTVYKS